MGALRYGRQPLHSAARSGHVELLEILAAREGIQRPCGSEESKYRQRCQWVQISDGLGHQMQLQSFSGPLTEDVPVRALQWIKLSVSSLVQLASGSNEPGEGGCRKRCCATQQFRSRIFAHYRCSSDSPPAWARELRSPRQQLVEKIQNGIFFNRRRKIQRESDDDH